jgi:hypothetical protein
VFPRNRRLFPAKKGTEQKRKMNTTKSPSRTCTTQEWEGFLF